jgi:hypothetical protein
MAIDKVVSASITDSSVTSAKVASGVLQPNFRNIIINGDMNIAQRATSASSLTSSAYNTMDRWHLALSSLGTWTQSQSTDVPTGQGFAKSMKLDCTSADASPSASDAMILQTRIEGQMLQYLKKGTSSAESTTMSFWVKSNKTGTYICELRDNDNSRQISNSYTISSADTWEKKEITFAGDTTGAFDNDNAKSLEIEFWLGAGTDYTSGSLATSWASATNANKAVGQVNLADSTSNEWYITGVQLEVGTAASDFEFLPVDVNLHRCYRYCYRINGNATDEQQIGGSSWCSTTSRVNHVAEFSPPLRAVPTITSSSDITETLTGTSGMSTGGLFDDNQSGLCNTVGVAIHPASGTPFTLYQTAFPRLANSTSSFIQYDAEL